MTPISKRQRKKTSEKVRNFLLVIVAVGMVVIFFNLDIIRDGESVFTKSAETKLRFKGDLHRKAYTDKEQERIISFVKKHDDSIESVTIETTRDSTYGKLTPSSQILFEIHIVLTDGATISTPTRRTARRGLVRDIIYKLNKDMKAYESLDGKEIKSLINTM